MRSLYQHPGRLVLGCIFTFICILFFSEKVPLRPYIHPSYSLSSQFVKWRDVLVHHPIVNYIPLPETGSEILPQIQHDFAQDDATSTESMERESRRVAVKEAFVRSWEAYQQNAWLHDELMPLTGTVHDPFCAWGATLVDSLDTLFLMGLEKEFLTALSATRTIDFTFCNSKHVSVFETTIRYLGGFLGAYDVTGGKHPELLEKAIEVGDMLYKAFDTPNRLPISKWNWRKALHGVKQTSQKSANIAELGTLSMEFTRLSQLTGDDKYFDAIQRVSNLFDREQDLSKLPGLWPIIVNPAEEDLHTGSAYSLGAMSDSAYEYLPKMYLLLQGGTKQYAKMYEKAVKAIKEYLLFEPLVPPENEFGGDDAALLCGITQVMETGMVDLSPRSDHLSCFASGMLGLGARVLGVREQLSDSTEDLDVALRLLNGCMWSYNATETGVGPEIFSSIACRRGRDAVTKGQDPDWDGARGNCSWDRDRWLRNVHGHPTEESHAALEQHVANHGIPPGVTQFHDPRYMLRPETIESLFVLFRITGDRKLQDHAWTLFNAITRWTRSGLAYASMPDVSKKPQSEESMRLANSMESFWMSETLKYFYLIFEDPEKISLDEFVFNTEAHPFRWRSKTMKSQRHEEEARYANRSANVANISTV